MTRSLESFWRNAVFLVTMLLMVALSSDLRLGLSLRLGGKPDFQALELVAFLLLGVTCVALPELISNYSFTPKKEDFFLLLFVGHAILTASLAHDPLHSISRAKDFLVSGFLYAFVRYGPLDRRQLNRLLYVLIGLACFWSLVGIWQWLGLDKDYGGDLYRLFLARQAMYKTLVDISAGDVVKSTFAHGLYLYPQNFIYYLIIPCAVCVGLAVKKPVLWGVVAIIFAAMLGTLSKTFFLLLLLFGGYLVLRKITGHPAVAAAVLAACAVAAVLAVFWFGNPRFWTKALGTFIWRLDIWSDTATMLLSRPSVLFTGHGTELLRDVYSREHYPNPHNMFLYFLIEYGIIGSALFFSFLYLAMRRAAVLGGKGAVSCGLHWRTMFYGMVVFLAMGVVDDIFVQTQLDGMVLLFLGFMMRAADSMAVEQEPDVREVSGLPGREWQCHG